MAKENHVHDYNNFYKTCLQCVLYVSHGEES